ncbi:hypothetical protein RND81_07G061100 [Saponaria officinalis]
MGNEKAAADYLKGLHKRLCKGKLLVKGETTRAKQFKITVTDEDDYVSSAESAESFVGVAGVDRNQPPPQP